MKAKFIFFGTLVFTSLLLSACPESGTDNIEECEIGELTSCLCPNGTSGIQTCKISKSFGECECNETQEEEDTTSDAGVGTDQSTDSGVANNTDDGPCPDNDNDGFHSCVDDDFPDRPTETDCDDTRWGVQPGGYEYPNNGIDDDCDGDVDETDELCDCPESDASGDNALAHAVGMCGTFFQSHTYDGKEAQKFWGESYYTIPPKEGNCLAVLSSGQAIPDFYTPTTNYYDSYDYDGVLRLVGFNVNEVGATFECQIDDNTPVTCTSPYEIPPQNDGLHELKVWAKDASNNVDPIPLVFLWTETTAPNMDWHQPNPSFRSQTPPQPLNIEWPQNNDVLGDSSFAIWGHATPTRSVHIQIKQNEQELHSYYLHTSSTGRWSVDQSIWENENLSTPLEDGFYEIHATIEEAWNNSYPAETQVINIEISSLTGALSAPVSDIDDIEKTGTATYQATFEADFETVTFECRTDFEEEEGVWASCTSPHNINTNQEGYYHFYVRALSNGLIEPLPDSKRFLHSSYPLTLLSPANDSTTSESQPAFIGTGKPNTPLSWTLTSSTDASFLLEGDDGVDFLGQWAAVPNEELVAGTYTLNVTYTPNTDEEENHSFTVNIDPSANDTSAPLTFYSHSLNVQSGTDFFVFSDDPAPPSSDDGDNGFTAIQDLAVMKASLTKPNNARGFAFDFMFMSAEFPEFLCQSYNDTFYAIIEASTVNGGAARNVSFDRNNNEITVNNAFFEPANDWSTSLSQSPYGAYAQGMCGMSWDGTCTIPDYCEESLAINSIGSGTGWLTTSVPLGDTEQDFSLSFSVHDEGDGTFDSAVLLSNFRWVLEPTELTTEKEP